MTVDDLEACGVALEEVRESQRAVRRAEAAHYVAANRFREAFESAGLGGELPWRSLRAEVASALCVSERAAEALLGNARVLAEELRGTFSAFSDGLVGARHAVALIEATVGMTAEERAQVERIALVKAETVSPVAFERYLRRVTASLHADDAAVRHERALAGRRVVLDPAADGMAWLSALLPAEQAVAAFDRLTAVGHAVAVDPAEERTLTQLRADAFAELVLNGASGEVPRVSATEVAAEQPGTDMLLAAARWIRPIVTVTVPVEALTGADDDDALAVLDGYGPIDPVAARRLTAGAPTIGRMFTDQDSGAVVALGRSRYRVTEELRAWLTTRDGTCRFPGCHQPARRCDIDHATPWENGGATDHDNLETLCRGHHRLKHHGGWHVEHVDDRGTLRWYSPLGMVHTTEPAVDFAAA